MSRRVFLDANVLFSAAWTPENGLLLLWTAYDIHLYSSHYAVAEAERNLFAREKKVRLSQLLELVTLVGSRPSDCLPDDASDLPTKDHPILLAAMAAEADVLLTGDRAHFGRWYGKTIGGIRVLPPADLLTPMLEKEPPATDH